MLARLEEDRVTHNLKISLTASQIEQAQYMVKEWAVELQQKNNQ